MRGCAEYWWRRYGSWGAEPHDVERIKEQVFKSNGIENIVKSMLNFPDHEDIQENACFCLQHFSQSGRVGVGD